MPAAVVDFGMALRGNPYIRWRLVFRFLHKHAVRNAVAARLRRAARRGEDVHRAAAGEGGGVDRAIRGQADLREVRAVPEGRSEATWQSVSSLPWFRGRKGSTVCPNARIPICVPRKRLHCKRVFSLAEQAFPEPHRGASGNGQGDVDDAVFPLPLHGDRAAGRKGDAALGPVQLFKEERADGDDSPAGRLRVHSDDGLYDP